MKTLNNLLLTLFPVILPFSLAYHRVLPDSIILGVPIDYLMPAIFASDFVFLGLLIIFLATNKPRLGKESLLLLSAILIVAFPLVEPISYNTAFYGYLRLALLLLEAIVLTYFFRSKQSRKFFLFGVSVSIILQSCWGILQVFLNKNLTEYFPFGETALSTYSPSIAKISVSGHTYLRAYGTTPHPNVLAGILVVFMLILLNRKFSSRSGSYFKLNYLPILFGVVGLLATFSRSGILAFGISLIYLVIKNNSKYKVLLISILVVALISILKILPFGSESLSVTERVGYSKLAILTLVEHPLTGIGLNQFLYYLPNTSLINLQARNLQPVHNIFLLWITETGILGLLVLIGVGKFILDRVRSSSFYTKAILISIIILGLLDHYLLTLPLGLGILGISIAVIFTEQEN